VENFSQIFIDFDLLLYLKGKRLKLYCKEERVNFEGKIKKDYKQGISMMN